MKEDEISTDIAIASIGVRLSALEHATQEILGMIASEKHKDDLDKLPEVLDALRQKYLQVFLHTWEDIDPDVAAKVDALLQRKIQED